MEVGENCNEPPTPNALFVEEIEIRTDELGHVGSCNDGHIVSILCKEN